MRLSTHDSFACSEAIAEVRRRADAACQAHDTEEALKALLEVRNACVRAAVQIREAAERARDHAQRNAA